MHGWSDRAGSREIERERERVGRIAPDRADESTRAPRLDHWHSADLGTMRAAATRPLGKSWGSGAPSPGRLSASDAGPKPGSCSYVANIPE